MLPCFILSLFLPVVLSHTSALRILSPALSLTLKPFFYTLLSGPHTAMTKRERCKKKNTS